MSDFIKRLKSEEDSALNQQLRSENVSARFRGLRRSKRNEAKLFLLAAVPVLVTALFVPKWSAANAAEKGVMVLTGTWFVIVLAVGSYFLFRTLIRISRSDNG